VQPSFPSAQAILSALALTMLSRAGLSVVNPFLSSCERTAPMNTPIKWNACGSREVSAIARPRWREIRHGLVLAVGGNVLLAPGLLGLLLLTRSLSEQWLAPLALEPEDAGIIGVVLAGLGVLGYVVGLVGRWRCLFHAPQGSSAKELQFACLLCYLVAPVCFVIAHFLGGQATYAALRSGPEALVGLDFLNGGVLLQVTGLLLVLLSVLLFSGFARAVARCMRDERGVSAGGRFFWFVAFLFGGTIGLFVEARHSARPETVPVLALGWLLCLLWHTWLMRGTSRRLARLLKSQGSRVVPVRPASPSRAAGQVVLQAATYLSQAQ
jgi:hypothetical protein